MSLGKAVNQMRVERGVEQASAFLSQGLRSGDIPAQEYSLKDLAHACMGDAWAVKLDKYRNGAYRGQESADAVDASAFAAITGNQLIDTVHAGYTEPGFIGDQLVTTISVTNGNLDTQKEPWLGEIMPRGGDQTDTAEYTVQQGMPYDRSEFLPNYILLRAPRKRGAICDVTFEMIYADRTRQAQGRAQGVGRYIRRLKEYEILRMVLGIDIGFTASFAGRAEASSPTYVETNTAATNSFGDRWQNHLDSTPLTSWQDLNAVEQLFSRMVDPSTGVPVEVEANTILVMPYNLHTAEHILRSVQTRFNDGASNSVQTLSNNDLKPYNVLSSKHARYLAANTATWPKQDFVDDGSTGVFTGNIGGVLNSDGLWYVGNFPKAFYYREVFPLQVMQAPPMNPLEFEKDIVISVKAREYGIAGVRDPRQVVRVSPFAFEDQTD